VSADGASWTTVVNSSLASSINVPCASNPLQVFNTTAVAPARYLRFTALSYYGYRAALQYITWVTY
jgi:hypothetical protein